MYIKTPFTDKKREGGWGRRGKREEGGGGREEGEEGGREEERGVGDI